MTETGVGSAESMSMYWTMATSKPAAQPIANSAFRTFTMTQHELASPTSQGTNQMGLFGGHFEPQTYQSGDVFKFTEVL
jgi:hypothetical protein